MFKTEAFTIAIPGPEVSAILIGMFQRLGCTVVEREFEYLVSHEALKDDEGRVCAVSVPRPNNEEYEGQMTRFLTGIRPGFVGFGRTVNPPFFTFLALLNEAVPFSPVQASPPADPPARDPFSQG